MIESSLKGLRATDRFGQIKRCEAANLMRKKSMSKVETPVTETDKKTYTFFNLDTLKMESKEIDVTFTPPVDYAEGVARLENDEKELHKAVTSYLRRKNLSAAKNSVVGEGAPKKVVLDFIAPLRNGAPFDAIFKADGKTIDRAAQTDAILAQVAQVPFMVANLKSLAAKAKADDDSDDDATDPAE